MYSCVSAYPTESKDVCLLDIKNLIQKYGKYIKEIGQENNSLILLEGDLADSTQSEQFQQKHPERHFQIGIAEQNMVGIAAGLALDWHTPVGPLSFSYTGVISKASTDKTEAFRFNLGTTF